MTKIQKDIAVPLYASQLSSKAMAAEVFCKTTMRDKMENLPTDSGKLKELFKQAIIEAMEDPVHSAGGRARNSKPG